MEKNIKRFSEPLKGLGRPTLRKLRKNGIALLTEFIDSYEKLPAEFDENNYEILWSPLVSSGLKIPQASWKDGILVYFNEVVYEKNHLNSRGIPTWVFGTLTGDDEHLNLPKNWEQLKLHFWKMFS